MTIVALFYGDKVMVLSRQLLISLAEGRNWGEGNIRGGGDRV